MVVLFSALGLIPFQGTNLITNKYFNHDYRSDIKQKRR